MENNKIINFIKSNFSFFLFGILFVILFRDFLYTYRIQLEKFLPYYDYQDQIMFYLTGDEKYDVKAPMNLRFLGLWVQFFIFQTIPCLELNHVEIVFPYPEYSCVIFSSALMNYLSLCGILSITFSYCYKKLNLDLSETILTVFLTYIYLDHVEAFTLDRISLLYLIVVLYFLDKKYLSIILVLFASLVNEKVVFILGVLFFLRFYLNKKLNFKYLFIASIFSGLLIVVIFYYHAIFMGNGYYGSNAGGESLYDTAFSSYGLIRVFEMFTSKSGLSNGFAPLLLSLLPYFLALMIKNNYKFYFSKLDFIIPLSLLIFTAGGGTEQTGRYVMYSMPLWLPIFSQQILFFIKKKNVDH